MPRRCLILGGGGFVGSAVTRAAAVHGWEATAAGKKDLADLTGTDWDVIINANGNSKKYISDQDPKRDFDLSVQSVAHSLHDFSCRQYVFLSSVDVYADKSDPANNHENCASDPMRLSRYGHHKWLAEELVRFNAPDWLIVRMAGFVGPGLKKNPVYDLLTGATLRVHPDSVYQYQSSDRVADQLFLMLDLNLHKEVVNLAGDGVISLRDIAALIPGAAVIEEETNLRLEHYEINIEKVKSLMEIEPSRHAVERFVRGVLSGEVKLA